MVLNLLLPHSIAICNKNRAKNTGVTHPIKTAAAVKHLLQGLNYKRLVFREFLRHYKKYRYLG